MSGGSEARRILSRLMREFGTDGVLVVRKLDGDDDTERPVGPGAALAWPKCECGSAKCPDYVAPASPASPTTLSAELSARLAERNQHSRRGRL
ncbi:hypothetical protein OG292_18450 [Streptomyces sp. NBC_01511]|uniref:hypothetical protein n=1 Tax=unclassified Streptomyces TaxID=2593676 RepID=UPI0038652983